MNDPFSVTLLPRLKCQKNPDTPSICSVLLKHYSETLLDSHLPFITRTSKDVRKDLNPTEHNFGTTENRIRDGTVLLWGWPYMNW